MRSRIFLCLSLFCLSNYVLGTTDLIFLRAEVSHNPDDGVAPPTTDDMLNKAHQQALKNYAPDSLQQVSNWQDYVHYCHPIYRGSSQCYEAGVSARASFIPKEKFNDDWQARVRGSSKAYENIGGKCSPKDWSDARHEAEKDAVFACNGPIINEPMNVERKSSQFLDTYYQECTYTATFKCSKN